VRASSLAEALVLVPEIALTPQLVDRFRGSLPAARLAVFHSGMGSTERCNAWLLAAQGELDVLIGTRSAVFLPLARPGLLVVDEEHDPSYKQQDGFRYSARDLAVTRGHRGGFPVLLGSATPALESLHNTRAGRYASLRLSRRAGDAAPPAMRLLDIRGQQLEAGLSGELLRAMDQHLGAGRQVLLFLNRRGFAPVLICHRCGWHADCERCDARMTFHRGRNSLDCHHCGSRRGVPRTCPECASDRLTVAGQGTERLEEVLSRRYPDAGVIRIDRDSTRRRASMEKLIGRVRRREGRILVGTQMLAKGHDFPEVTLAGLVDADQGLFTADFRGPERMAQLLVQVAGRAGRGEHAGEVLVQTRAPEHPLLRRLVTDGYPAFAGEALSERRAVGFPPFSHLAVLRSEAAKREHARAFLEQAVSAGDPVRGDAVWLLGPVPAPMERRAGRYRAQVLVQSDSRARLHRFLASWAPALENLPGGKRVRWSLDVDPIDLS
jgi:primosomal protein N' (replication factor Y)